MLCFSTWHAADELNMPTPPISGCRVDFVFLFSLISTCFPLTTKHTLELSSVATHQQTCPSPTFCDIFIAMSSNAGSPHQGSEGWRRQEYGSNCHFQQLKPPALFLKTQEPLSHKWATGTYVKEPAAKNLKMWTKDTSSGLSSKLIPFSWLYLHIHTDCTKL